MLGVGWLAGFEPPEAHPAMITVSATAVVAPIHLLADVLVEVTMRTV